MSTTSSNSKLLIIGIVGNTPAAIHATLFPFLEDFSKNYSAVDLLMGARNGKQPSVNFLKKLKQLPIPKNCSFLPDFSAEGCSRSSSLQNVISQTAEYEKVVLLCKGGLNGRVAKLFLELREQHPSLEVIQSDGTDSICYDCKDNELERKALASLPITNHLDLIDSSIEAEKLGYYSAKNALLVSGKTTLQVYAASSVNNYLRIWIDGRQWNSTQDYNICFWRDMMDRIQKFNIKQNHVTLIMGDATSKHIIRRALGEGFHCTMIPPDEAELNNYPHAQPQFQPLLTELEVKDVNTTVSPKNKRVLLTAMSSTEDTTTLNTIFAHGAGTNIVLYDPTYEKARIAASRLSTLVATASKKSPIYKTRIFFHEATHIPRETIKNIIGWRNELVLPFEINVSPGPKRLSMILAMCARADDTLFKLDTNSNKELQLINLDSEEKTEPAHYPSLLQTGYFCAGTVSTKRRMTQENLPNRARDIAEIIISYLHDQQFSKSLAQAIGSPVHTHDGSVQFKHGGRFNFKKAFAPCNIADHSLNQNEWLELVMAAEMINQGADEVLQGMEWIWDCEPFNENDHNPKCEMDVVARFKNKIVCISCKTSAPTMQNFSIERWHKHCHEHHYATRINLGKFARPAVVFPTAKPSQNEHIFPDNCMWINDIYALMISRQTHRS